MEEKGLVERLCDAKQKCGECVPFDEPCPVAEVVYDRHNAEVNKEIAKVLEGLHEDNELKERLADLEHTRWAHWQSYLHSRCTKNPDGSLTIPAGYVAHWERQIGLPYDKLTEKEKDSDRAEAEKTMNVIDKYFREPQ